MTNPNLKRTLGAIGSLVGLLLFAGWFFLLRPPALGGATSYIMVTGQSMQPTFWTGDLVLVRRQRGYRTGQVIAFRAEGGVVIHRIVAGKAEDGFYTRGDNKPANDPWRPKPNNIVGAEWLYLPNGGRYVTRLRDPRLTFALLAVIVLAGATGGSEVKRRRQRTGGRRMTKAQ